MSLLAQALADDNRLRILLALRNGALCTCHVTELLGVAPSTASKHLSVLRRAHLLQAKRQGRWVHYRLSTLEDGVPGEALEAIDWVGSRLGEAEVARRDRAQLQEILAKYPPDLECV